MLHIAICDDNAEELEHTYNLAEKHVRNRPEMNIAIRCFRSGYDLLEAVDNHGHFDIYLLDILMPEVNGIEIGAELRRQDKAAVIIYLTSSPDFALDSYHVRAHGYLLKPCEEKKLFDLMDETIEQLSIDRTRKLLLNTRHGTESIPFSLLVYVEYVNHRLVCHLFNKDIVESSWYRKPFGYAADILTQDSRFVKISAAHVVNMQHVKAITPQGFLMIDANVLPITRTYSSAKQKYLDFILERGWQV